MKYPITYIKYLDTAVYDQGEFGSDYHFQLVVFEAVGWLFKEDQEAVYLAREVNTTNRDNLRAVLLVPKINILKRQEFTSPKLTKNLQV